jgi:hypothetical protein
MIRLKINIIGIRKNVVLKTTSIKYSEGAAANKYISGKFSDQTFVPQPS